MSESELAFAPATHQLAQLASGQTTAAELLELYLVRIERYNPTYNLVVAFDI
jgi:amidase